ncbi:hypothetical protein HMPREF1555_01442 [Porphyromonas gingivalis F0570]|uniref:Uncharacterized protein n=1 Tax=Porphyromonas gingivalis F0570 TaxID=1227271 RepID=A0A0E2LQA8_PORGN|nr:hypothetical protein HMPREF1555_01442 [Porphyromonas gingivalis F0570]
MPSCTVQDTGVGVQYPFWKFMPQKLFLMLLPQPGNSNSLNSL